MTPASELGLADTTPRLVCVAENEQLITLIQLTILHASYKIVIDIINVWLTMLLLLFISFE